MTRNVTPLQAYLLQRGLFSRVARKLGIDPSYVSRVASGERRSEQISQALNAEFEKINVSKRKSSKKYSMVFKRCKNKNGKCLEYI
jgi:hypothetical protein